MAFLWILLMFLATLFLFGQGINCIIWLFVYNYAIDKGMHLKDQKVMAKLLFSALILLILYAVCWVFTGLYAGNDIWGDFVGAAVGIIVSWMTYWKSKEPPYSSYANNGVTETPGPSPATNKYEIIEHKNIVQGSDLYLTLTKIFENSTSIPIEHAITTLNGCPTDIYIFDAKHSENLKSSNIDSTVGAVVCAIRIKRYDRLSNNHDYFEIKFGSDYSLALSHLIFDFYGNISNRIVLESGFANFELSDILDKIRNYLKRNIC